MATRKLKIIYVMALYFHCMALVDKCHMRSGSCYKVSLKTLEMTCQDGGERRGK